MGLTYKDAGVDKDKGYAEVSLIKEMVKKTQSPEVLTDIGGFSGLFAPDLRGIEEPVLVSGTDGVGTKIKLAQELDIHNTVGIDCVAMCVNDIICQGARPLFFLDYIACGKLIPEKTACLVDGVSQGCIQAGASLIGGETAEMPGIYGEDDYDLAGFAVGLVDRKKIINGSKIKAGDLVIGLKSTGVHSNGFSLVRAALKRAGVDLIASYDEKETIGQRLLTPTKIYAREILSLTGEVEVKGIANITGGGLYENVPRTLPANVGIDFDLKKENIDRIFTLIQDRGDVETEEMFHTFNMGVGMVVIVGPEDAEKALALLNKEGQEDFATIIGQCRRGNKDIKINLN